jgi:hypothetical protein
MLNILSLNEKKSTDKPNHVVFPKKQQAIRVDGVSDLDEFNEFSDMSLFVDDHLVKIRNVERSIPQNLKNSKCLDYIGHLLCNPFMLQCIPYATYPFLFLHVRPYAYFIVGIN